MDSAVAERKSPAEEGAMVAEVAVLAPAPGPYSYAVPTALLPSLRSGSRVMVPLGGQAAVEGVVLRLVPGGSPQPYRDPRVLRPILEAIDGPAVPAELLGLVSFVAQYYLAPIGEALRLVLPPHQQAEQSLQLGLTAAGVALAGQLDGALLPVAASALPDLQLALLTALAQRLLTPASGRRATTTISIEKLAKAPGLSKRTPAPRIGELHQALRELADAGLVSRHSSIQAAVPEKSVTRVAVRPTPLTTEEERLLARSPARASLWRHLLRFGPLTMTDLQAVSERAAVLVKQLSKAGLVDCSRQLVSRDPLSPDAEHDDDSPFPLLGEGDLAPRTGSDSAAPPLLTDEQAQALAPMLSALDHGYAGFLLKGVTGSGKTELYLQLIAAALSRGKSALVLVPEIALTPQLASRFIARFGPQVAVLHSGLSPGQRADAWRRILRAEVRIALGPRSALFAPLSDLGVVIVDEEHDSSFKQQDGVRYHGRDVALVRAQRVGAVAVLGSATPSLESLALTQRGKLGLLTLHKRATGQPLPKVEVIDLKQYILTEDRALLSAPLERALAETLGAGEQALLFLNRRGYATFLLCKSCGHRLECRHCAVTLTWHKGSQRLLCHYCGYSEPPTEICPLCHAETVIRLGLGTEKLHEQIVSRFPAARVARLDRDTAGDLGKLLSAMHRRDIDILIGTQMLAKGHDFPGVTLVGVILADTGMGLPDFRASERTFQLLAQVAGRAGRAQRPGRVLIQTYNPEHPAVLCAVEHDYDRFAELELAARAALSYAPYMRIGLLRLDGADPLAVRSSAEKLAQAVAAEVKKSAVEILIQGPAEAPLSRLKGRSRWQLLVRAPTSQALRSILWSALRTPVGRGVRVHADVDPASTL